MKRLLAMAVFATAAVNPSFAGASTPATVAPQQLGEALVQLLDSGITALELVDWKVGDTSSYDIKAGMFGKLGTMTKTVTKDEDAALWVTQQMDIMIQKQKVETLINKADGKVLKMIVNGQEQKIPDDKVEIISQDYTEITVPAGTFKAIHVVAKTAQAPKIEVWANPRDTVMEGTLKQIISTQGIEMTMELTSFKRAQ